MIGFDIGGTKCAVSVGTEHDGILDIKEKRIIDTDLSVSPYVMLDRMCDIAREMTDDLSRIGISCGGPLDPQRGIILSPPNLRGWDEVRAVEYIEEKLGGKAALRNDADACALAEYKYGAGRGYHSMAFFTFGTGLGAGLILGGKLWQGSRGLAGEAGHIRLAEDGPVGYRKKGSFEGFCSGNGMAQLGRAAAKKALDEGKVLPYCKSYDDLDRISAKLLADYAREGEPVAKSVFDETATRLGQGLAIVFDLLDIEVAVIGSIFTRCEDLLREGMEKVLFAEALSGSDCKVLPAALGEKIGDYAALSVASEI